MKKISLLIVSLCLISTLSTLSANDKSKNDKLQRAMVGEFDCQKKYHRQY